MRDLQKPQTFLIQLAALVFLSFSVGHALLNSFVIERGAFTGAETGVLQSLREVPVFFPCAMAGRPAAGESSGR